MMLEIVLLWDLIREPCGPFHPRPDRPGPDRRYAIDAHKLEAGLDWKPAETFETGIRKTVQWYLGNSDWVKNVQSGAYREWVSKQYKGSA